MCAAMWQTAKRSVYADWRTPQKTFRGG